MAKYCPMCGKSFNDSMNRCTMCGTLIDFSQDNKKTKSISERSFVEEYSEKFDILAFISMICGIISFFCSLLITPFPLIGLICGIISFVRMKKDSVSPKYKAMSLIGIIFSSLFLFLNVLVIALLIYL